MMTKDRGVYVRRTVSEAIEITAIASDGRILVSMVVDPAIYSDRMIHGMERLLDRSDPTLKLVQQ
jgi:hypothetical protein